MRARPRETNKFNYAGDDWCYLVEGEAVLFVASRCSIALSLIRLRACGAMDVMQWIFMSCCARDGERGKKETHGFQRYISLHLSTGQIDCEVCEIIKQSSEGNTMCKRTLDLRDSTRLTSIERCIARWAGRDIDTVKATTGPRRKQLGDEPVFVVRCKTRVRRTTHWNTDTRRNENESVE